MKKFLLLMFLCCGASGYAQQTEIPFESTILVEATDSDEEVIAKAAHVVPTANQLAALKNEFIAFVHFGLTPSPVWSGATARKIPGFST